MKMEVWEEEDPYASIVNLCPQTVSLEKEIHCCPFLRAADIDGDSIAERVDSTFSDDNGIIMLSLSDSFCSLIEETEDEAVFCTPPEHASLVRLSSSEDQILDEVCGENLTNRSRVGEEEMGDEMDKKITEEELDVVGSRSESEGNDEVSTVDKLGRDDEVMRDSMNEIDEGLVDLELINSCEVMQDGTTFEQNVEDEEKDILDRDEGEGDKPIEDGDKDILDEGEETVEDREKDNRSENNVLVEIHESTVGGGVNGGKEPFEDKEKGILDGTIGLKDILNLDIALKEVMHEYMVNGGPNKGKRPLDKCEKNTDIWRKNPKLAESTYRRGEKNLTVGNQDGTTCAGSVEDEEKDVRSGKNGMVEIHGSTVGGDANGGKEPFVCKKKGILDEAIVLKNIMRKSGVNQREKMREKDILNLDIALEEVMHEYSVKGGPNKDNRPLDNR